MKKFFKQPNGMYCYFSYNGVEGFDLTEEDVKRIYIEEAESEAEWAINNAKNFGAIIEELLYRNSHNEDEWLKHIGFTEPYRDLVKYVPRKPIDQHYVGYDFTTYAKCPSCGEVVQTCMGNKQEKCICGQFLQWD